MQQSNPLTEFLQEISNVLDVSVLSRISMMGQAPAEANMYGIAHSMFNDMTASVGSKCLVSLKVNGKVQFSDVPAISLIGAETYELERAEEILEMVRDITFYIERSHDSVASVKDNIRSKIEIADGLVGMFESIKFEMSPLSKQLFATMLRLYFARLNAEYLETYATGKKLHISINYKVAPALETLASNTQFLQDFAISHSIT